MSMSKNFWGFGIATAAALLMTATVASAKPEPKWQKRAPKERPAVVKAVSVPEIDAHSGLAAMAALCAALALAWERREKA